MNKIQQLEDKCRLLRQYVLAAAVYAGGAHISPAYSIMEILTTLYYEIMNIHPENADHEDRDRFILSKGHAGAALFAVLAARGFIEKDELKRYCKIGGILGGHPDKLKVNGVEASTGSLGHGLSIGCGIALAGKKRKKGFKVYSILGDGECQEGSVWEGAMFAASQELDNLIVIVDQNQLQGMGRVEQINTLEPLEEKWRSFGWSVQTIDGHNFNEILKSLVGIPFAQKRPSAIIAKTIKGKGVSFMEDKAIWHYRLPNEEEMKIACEELQIKDINEVLS